MERGSNLNIPDFVKEHFHITLYVTTTLSHYAVCDNNPQSIEWWVQLGTTVNHQGPRNMTQFSMAVIVGGAVIIFLFQHFLIRYDIFC